MDSGHCSTCLSLIDRYHEALVVYEAAEKPADDQLRLLLEIRHQIDVHLTAPDARKVTRSPQRVLT
jgi:hypothetical protein